MSGSDPVQRFWEVVGEVFDPKQPVRDPALFAERKPEYDEMGRLEKLLRRPFDDQKYLVAGSVGNGKTSSLIHLSSNLAQHRMVVFVDLWAHFQGRVRDVSALDRVEPWELVGLLGLAIIRAGEQRFGHSWGDEPKVLEAALAKLRESEDGGDAAEIDVMKLARGLAVAAGGVVGAVTGGPVTAALGAGAAGTAMGAGLKVLDVASDATRWTWRLGLGDGRRRSDQDSEVRDVLHAVNALILKLQGEYGKRLVLVVDGIDRVRDPGRLEVLFVHSSLLGELSCDEVFTVPTAVFDGAAHHAVAFASYELCNVPVLRREDPSSIGPDIEFFHQLVAKRLVYITARLADQGGTVPCDDPIPAAVIDKLAYYSGGLVREFVRMIVFAAGEAWEARAEAISDEIVLEVLRNSRGLKESRITKGEIALLEQVMEDPEHQLPDGPMARELLREQRLLPYPNETPWYYPHPLLTLVVLRPGSRSAS
ncbi:MAG: hypothetical protein AAGF11_14280 [Myxococcota bacterium]